MKVHSRPGDRLLDFFAGSGTLGEAAAAHGRDAVLIDSNPEAIAVMTRRLDKGPALFPDVATIQLRDTPGA